MKRLITILVIIAVFCSCKKKDALDTNGTITIDNTIYIPSNPYSIGFNFSLAKKVSTLDTPAPDITVDNDGTLTNLILEANNFKNSFYNVGNYPDATAAEQAFINLTTVNVLPSQWIVWAFMIKPNQVWIFRTSDDHYAKIRIISIEYEVRAGRNFAGCTFQWTYQPDGSLTFPPK